MIRKPIRRTKYARRERHPEYRKWIRTLPCFLCESIYNIEAAHIGPRAYGRKCDDRETVPACWRCHQTGPTSLHRMGKRFWAYHQLDRVALIAKYQQLYREHLAQAA